MSTPSTRLGLILNSLSDPFLLSDQLTTLGILDSFPGVYINTASAIATEVSSWGSAQNGQYIYDTTNAVLWQWNGTTKQRPFPQGLLSSVTNTTGANITTTSATSVLSTTTTVPTGGRSVKVSAFLPSVYNATATTTLELLIGATVVQTITVPSALTLPYSLWAILPSSVASAGSHTFYLEAYVGTASTTSGLAGSATSPIELSVEEV